MKCTICFKGSIEVDLSPDDIISSLINNDFFTIIDASSQKIIRQIKDAGIDFQDVTAIYRNDACIWEE